MRIHSDSFGNREPIPAEFAAGAPGGFGGNRNPHLAWDEVPAGTRSFVVMCVDTDAPTDASLAGREDVLREQAFAAWRGETAADVAE